MEKSGRKCALAGSLRPCQKPRTHHEGVLLMGLGHELWFALADAQAHGPRRGPHEGVAHLTDDPGEKACLPVRSRAGAGVPVPTARCHNEWVFTASQQRPTHQGLARSPI